MATSRSPRAASATIRRCSAIPTSRPIRAGCRRATLGSTAMKACCRASRRGNCCPSTRSNGCPGSRRAASIRAPAFPTSTARSDASTEVTNAPPVYSKDETPTAFLAGEFIRWLGEQDAALVRAYLLHLAASALHRAGALQHHVRSGRRPDFRRAGSQEAERLIHPYVGARNSTPRSGRISWPARRARCPTGTRPPSAASARSITA